MICLDFPFSLMMQYSLAIILKQSFKSAQIMALYVNLQPSTKDKAINKFYVSYSNHPQVF